MQFHPIKQSLINLSNIHKATPRNDGQVTIEYVNGKDEVVTAEEWETISIALEGNSVVVPKFHGKPVEILKKK